MSPIGTKRTWRDAWLESVLRLEADLGQQPDAPTPSKSEADIFWPVWWRVLRAYRLEVSLFRSATALLRVVPPPLGWGVVNSLELIRAGPVGLLHTQKVRIELNTKSHLDQSWWQFSNCVVQFILGFTRLGQKARNPIDFVSCSIP